MVRISKLIVGMLFFCLVNCAQESDNMNYRNKRLLNQMDLFEAYPQIGEIAHESIQKNLVQYKGKRYLRAGYNQFASLWTRDFAYSVSGLLSSGYEKVVLDQLELILHFVRPEDNLVPRSLDIINPKWRVIFGLYSEKRNNNWGEETLHPEYLGENNTPSMDGNVLVALAIFEYARHVGNLNFVLQYQRQIKALLSYYDHFKNSDGLIEQLNYSDWQDSVQREGANFLLNYQYWRALSKLCRIEGIQINACHELGSLKEKIKEKFYHPGMGLFKSTSSTNHISLEGNLFAIIDSDFLNSNERKRLYENLKNHPVWNISEIPGISTFPNYPESWASIQTTLVGLENYHGMMLWSWLVGLSAYTSKYMEDYDEAKRILDGMNEILARDNTVYEIYDAESLEPYKSGLKLKFSEFTLPYVSEAPFSWGAAYLLQALYKQN